MEETSDAMVTILFNATTEIIDAVEYEISFNETVNDSAIEDVYDNHGGGHDYGNSLFDIISLYLKIVIDVVGMLGNLVVILLVVVFHDLHSAANYHFLNMAFADFILLLENLLTRIGNIVNYDVFSALECVPVYIHTVVVQTSSLTLAALSIDRYKLIVHPLKNLHDRSTMKVVASLIVVWFVSFALHIPVVLFSVKTHSYCRVVIPWEYGSLVLGIYSNIVLFYLPTAIVLFCNLKIIEKIRRKKPGLGFAQDIPKPSISNDGKDLDEQDLPKKCASAQGGAERRPPTLTTFRDAKRRPGRRTRSTRIVVTVVAVYIALNLPFYTFYTISLIPSVISWKVYFEGHKYLALMLLLNSAINPFIYSFMGAKYRNHIRHMLRCLCSFSFNPPTGHSKSQSASKQGTESEGIDQSGNANEI